MTLNQLTYFQTVARLEHFRKAADELNISQPSLSHSIASLEDELGVKLFNRNGRNVTLTKYGKIFLEKVDSILFEIHLAEKQMKRLAGNKGHIDIAYVAPLSYIYIPKLIRNFLEEDENKEVTFSFHQCLTKDVIAGILKDKYDAGFCALVPEYQNDIEFIPLLKQEMVLITSLDHDLASKDVVDFDELENYPFIGYDKTSALGSYTRFILKNHSSNPEIIYECPDENSIASLVSEDFGIAIVADIDSLENYNIKKIKLNGKNLYHTVYLAYKRDSFQPKSLKNFLKFVNSFELD